MPKRLNIALFGPYGAGKGTQAQILRGRFDMAYFDTGSVLRKNVEDKTPLGIKAKEIMDRGELVSNDLIMKIVSSWIESIPKEKNILFDGIPRFLEQALTFDQILKDKEISVLKIFIDIPRKESIRRQVERRICQKCGKIFPITFNEDVCDFDQGALIIRKENDPEIAEKRANIFEEETLPVISYYKDKNEIISIDGMQSIENVTAEIIKIIENFK